MTNDENESPLSRIKHKLFGPPKDPKERSIFHKLSLIPVLAWIGMGADGLSSSAYGPEQAYRALQGHVYLAVFVGLLTAITIIVISYCYCCIIEHFPHGGGGYIVATHTLGRKLGLISGCALLVDYILTIAVSIASCVDSVFSFLPISYHGGKIFVGGILIIMLIILNIRGVKESVIVLTPIFISFMLTHIMMLLWGVFSHRENIPSLINGINSSVKNDIDGIGLLGITSVLLYAFSLGGGTFTGLEAVSNGLPILREPKVKTGKRVMVYMATSLSFIAVGFFLCYLLYDVKHEEGRTLNAVLSDRIFRGIPYGGIISLITILSESALLIVAAQTGFVDGPRVMANMAVDSWLPHRFSALSERLTLRNGITLMGFGALLIYIYTSGSIESLIVMYSINVFITITLSILGMAIFYYKNRNHEKKWLRDIVIMILGFTLSTTILMVTTYEKFFHGGWLSILITAITVGLCFAINKHYENVRKYISKLDEAFTHLPSGKGGITSVPDPREKTAIQLVSGFNGFGIHTFYSIINNFPNLYKNFIFISVAVIDSGNFKGAKEIANLERSTIQSLEKYVNLARNFGFASEWRMTLSNDVVEAATSECIRLSREFKDCTVFMGQLTFGLEKFYHRVLHNETAFAIQRRLQEKGITSVILPIRLD
ncbi:MAG: APC family permease [Candidatus Aenigmatarchaeota archaeon]